MKRLLAGIAGILGVWAATSPANAAVLPVSVEFSPGSIIAPGPLPGRDDPNSALSGPDGEFLSLGFGGIAVFDFGEVLPGGVIDIVEVTFLQYGPHAESVDVFAAQDFTSGDFSLTGFASIGSVSNVDAQSGMPLTISDPFQYVALVDTSPLDGGSFDGFDIDVITAHPVPLPPAVAGLAAALAGLMLLSRKRKAIRS